MSVRLKEFFSKLVPYLGMGIFVVLMIIGFVVFSYVLLLGALIGIVLFAIAYIKNRFFSRKDVATYYQRRQFEGKVYDHHDVEKTKTHEHHDSKKKNDDLQ